MQRSAMSAHPRYPRRLFVRSLFVWLLVRVVLSALATAAGVPIVLGSRALVLLTACVAVLAQVDARVMREMLLHENLGTHRWLPVGVAVLVVLTAELIIRLIAGAM